MLLYRAWRQWARRHAPWVLMGVYTTDEMPEEPREVEGRVVEDPVPARPREDQAEKTPTDSGREAPAGKPAPSDERAAQLAEAKRIARKIHGEAGGGQMLLEVKKRAGVEPSHSYDEHEKAGGDLGALLDALRDAEIEMGVD
jgi:hypothetical protein